VIVEAILDLKALQENITVALEDASDGLSLGLYKERDTRGQLTTVIAQATAANCLKEDDIRVIMEHSPPFLNMILSGLACAYNKPIDRSQALDLARRGKIRGRVLELCLGAIFA
jgi:hypothetical protein